jgi:shikimate kinase
MTSVAEETTPPDASPGATAAPEANTLAQMTRRDRTIVLVGLMGVGKTTIGRRLAQRLNLPFTDADAAIEEAAGETISDIFAKHGETYFRDGERRVIVRLLEKGPQVLATGGGAFMDPVTRDKIAAHGISVWLRADLDVLMRRVGRRGTRPLLKNDNPRATMEKLMTERYPIYAQADITVESEEGPHDSVVDDIIRKLEALQASSGGAK